MTAPMAAKEVPRLARDKEARIVDLRLCDIHGAWQRFAIPASELTEDVIERALASTAPQSGGGVP